jgi:CRISPR-associated protein Cas6/Cse3/CasE subtype I-E
MDAASSSSTVSPIPLLAQLAVRVPEAVAAVRGSLTHAGQRDESLLLKTVLTEALGGPWVRPWRLQGVRDGTATILGYSVQDADTLRERLAFALPALQQAVAVVATAPLPPLHAGQGLRFRIRLVPTIRQTGKGEIDALLYAVRKDPAGQHDRARIYIDYLTARLAGAEVQHIGLDGTRLASMVRRQGPHWTERVFPIAEMSGTLTISDAGQFTALLTQGLGRQRGYGFGFIRLEPTH